VAFLRPLHTPRKDLNAEIPFPENPRIPKQELHQSDLRRLATLWLQSQPRHLQLNLQGRLADMAARPRHEEIPQDPDTEAIEVSGLDPVIRQVWDEFWCNLIARTICAAIYMTTTIVSVAVSLVMLYAAIFGTYWVLRLFLVL